MNNKTSITAFTKDLWKIANEQVDKLNVQKSQILAHSFQQKSRQSMDQIFSRANSTINKLMPTGQHIKSSAKNVPESIKLLDRYAQKMGFLPMGQIYDGSGSGYVGRVQQKTKQGQTFYKQFLAFGDQLIDSPDVNQNLTYHANRTISKWNQFVKSQSQLGIFLKNIQTQEGRKQLINRYAKTSTKASDQLRMLSSLYYYYVDQKSSNKNILLLSKQNQSDLVALLKSTGKIEQIFENALTIIASGRLDVYQYIKNYHQYKIATIKTSITDQQFDSFAKQWNPKLAYIPDQMIGIPIKTHSKWFDVLQNKQGSWESKMMTDTWNSKAQWFKAVNYIKM